MRADLAGVKADFNDYSRGITFKDNGKIDTDEVGPRAQLLALIIDNFNIDELKTLSFEIGVFWEHLDGNTLPSKSQSLIEFCERNGRLFLLISKCQEKKGHLEWPSL